MTGASNVFLKSFRFLLADSEWDAYIPATGRAREELTALMSKAMYITRLAFTVCVACLQLFLLPATQLLHVGCNHSHQSADCEAHANAVHSHHADHGHSCGFHHGHSTPQPDGGRPDHHSHSPHDSHSCPICQIVLAARICELDEIRIPSNHLTVAWSGPHVPEVCSAPGYILPSRGPPV